MPRIILPYQDFYFEIDDSDRHEVKVVAKQDGAGDSLWHALLKGLWADWSVRPDSTNSEAWRVHTEGDYFQQTITRNNRTLHPHQSYTAMFHELLRTRPPELAFIRNIYSTSAKAGFTFGYTLYDGGRAWWKRQVNEELADWIDTEERFKSRL